MKHFILRIKEVTPALGEMIEQRALVWQQLVVTLIEPDAHDGQIQIVRLHRRVIFREERHLLWGLLILTKKLHRATPGRLLPPIEFAEEEPMALRDTTIQEPTIFHHTPVVVSLAIFDPFERTQEHNG